MDHYTATSTLGELLPQINEGTPAKDVLIKYANDNNLAPAVLERLGQLFNTAKTVTVMKEASTRGQSFEVLDIEDMLSTYMQLDSTDTEEPVQKSASEGTTVVAHNPFSLPNVFKEEDISKSAGDTPRSEQHEKFVNARMAKEAEEAEFENKVYLDEVAILKHKLQEDIHTQINKLARWVYDTEPTNFSDLTRDSLSCEHQNRNALDHVAAKLDDTYAGSYVEFDMTKAASVKLTRDTTGKLEELTKLEDDIQLYAGCQDILKSANEATLPPENDIRIRNRSSEPITLDSARTAPRDTEAERETRQRQEAENSSNESDDDDDSGNELQNRMESSRRSQQNRDAELGDLSSRSEQNERDEAAASADRDQRVPQIKSKIDSAADSLASKADEFSKGQTSKLHDALFSVPTSDTRRKSRDEARRGVYRAAILQRVIAKDPVLKQADPKRVVSLYNTLYAANPEMLSDPNILSYMLREAVEYDGVAPHTYNDLSDTRKKRAETRDKENNTENQKYNINSLDRKPKA